MAEDAHSHWANDSPLRLNPIGSLHRQGLPRTESWLSQSPHLDFPSYEERNLASHPPWARATFQAVGLGQGGRLPSLRSTFGTLSSGAAYSTLWSLPPASTSLETSNSDLDGALSGHVGPQASDAGSSSSTRAVTGAPSPDGVPLASGSPRRGHELPLHTSDSHGGFTPELEQCMSLQPFRRYTQLL